MDSELFNTLNKIKFFYYIFNNLLTTYINYAFIRRYVFRSTHCLGRFSNVSAYHQIYTTIPSKQSLL